jgi:hypothetical protein
MMRGLPWRGLWGLLSAGIVAGCVSSGAIREAELKQWVGRSETELAGAFGAPNRSYDAGGMKFLTYEERRVSVTPGGPDYFGPGPFWYGGGGFPPTATTLVCDTTFTIVRGVVKAFSLRGNACG